MPKFGLATLAFVALFTLAPLSVIALSVDRDSGINADGTAKFADPDEQKPDFMNGAPMDETSGHTSSHVTLPVTPNARAGISINRFGAAPRKDAFDEAYDRK